MLVYNFGVRNKEDHGMLWYFWSGQLKCLAITCSKLLGFGTNSGYARLPQPLIFGAFFFSLKGCGFHQ